MIMYEVKGSHTTGPDGITRSPYSKDQRPSLLTTERFQTVLCWWYAIGILYRFRVGHDVKCLHTFFLSISRPMTSLSSTFILGLGLYVTVFHDALFKSFFKCEILV